LKSAGWGGRQAEEGPITSQGFASHKGSWRNPDRISEKAALKKKFRKGGDIRQTKEEKRERGEKNCEIRGVVKRREGNSLPSELRTVYLAEKEGKRIG